MEIIEIFKSRGFHVTILTNGSLLDERAIEKLIALRVEVVKVSLWASNEEEFRKNYPAMATRHFRAILHALRRCAESKQRHGVSLPSVWIHNPLTRHNFDAIPRMVEIAHQFGCNGISFAPLIDYRGVSDRHHPSSGQMVSIRHHLRSVRRTVRQYGLDSNLHPASIRFAVGPRIWERAPCYFVWMHARIRGDGDIYPCCRCDISLGNVNRQTFAEAWCSEPFQNLRRRLNTKEGLAAFQKECDCRYCFHLYDNIRIHRVMGPFRPIANAGSR